MILLVVRIVNAWNNLPKDVVHTRSLTLFRNRLGLISTLINTFVNSFNYDMQIMFFTIF